MSWRRLQDEGVSAASGLATDEDLCQRVGLGESKTTLRLYTYRPHCVLVGRFQDVDREVRLDVCGARGIEVNRRPTGGGTILMGPGQLGVALILPAREVLSSGRLREGMIHFGEGITKGLALLGVESKFRGKNDLAVNGKKLVGLGMYRSPSQGLLFHASVLVDFDLRLMLEVLKSEPSTGGEAEFESVQERITTLKQHLDPNLQVGDVATCVERGLTKTFDVTAQRGTLSPEEAKSIERLVEEKYRRKSWIHQDVAIQRQDGRTLVRTDRGDLEARVQVAGSTIQTLSLRGDFLDPEETMLDLEGRMKWHAAEPTAVEATVLDTLRREEPIPGRQVVAAILGAIDDAKRHSSAPYGCFVNPQGSQEKRKDSRDVLTPPC